MNVLGIAGLVFMQPWLWFSELLEATGMTGVFLAALAMYLAYKFLVAPFLGSSGSSDTAEQSNSHRRR